MTFSITKNKKIISDISRFIENCSGYDSRLKEKKTVPVYLSETVKLWMMENYEVVSDFIFDAIEDGLAFFTYFPKSLKIT